MNEKETYEADCVSAMLAVLALVYPETTLVAFVRLSWLISVIARSRTLSHHLWCVCLALVVLPVLRVERR